MRKTLLIDGQVLQTAAWYRGMGKYTLQAMQALDRKAGKELEVEILFNSAIACPQERYETVKFLCPNIKQLFCSLPLPQQKNVTAEDYKKALDLFVTDRFGGNIYYLITAPLFLDFFAEFPDNCHKLTYFYDLTPPTLLALFRRIFPT